MTDIISSRPNVKPFDNRGRTVVTLPLFMVAFRGGALAGGDGDEAVRRLVREAIANIVSELPRPAEVTADSAIISPSRGGTRIELGSEVRVALQTVARQAGVKAEALLAMALQEASRKAAEHFLPLIKGHDAAERVEHEAAARQQAEAADRERQQAEAAALDEALQTPLGREIISLRRCFGRELGKLLDRIESLEARANAEQAASGEN